MVRRGGKVHLIEGFGVSEDPTWTNQNSTKDGRGWNSVPGAGGAPYARMPTRIVVNRLYEGHGSTNLVLHEHAHSLDSTYTSHGVSSSQLWKNLMRENPEVNNFLDRKCGDYCNTDERERFAELFAIYHDCGGGKAAMVREIPRIAEFFRTFKSVKELNRNAPSSSRRGASSSWK